MENAELQLEKSQILQTPYQNLCLGVLCVITPYLVILDESRCREPLRCLAYLAAIGTHWPTSEVTAPGLEPADITDFTALATPAKHLMLVGLSNVGFGTV